MGRFFDERFAKSARQALVLWPLRIAMAAIVAVVLGLAIGWTGSIAWTAKPIRLEELYAAVERALAAEAAPALAAAR